VLDDVRAGESIWFDDGKIGSVIEKVEHDKLNVRITEAPTRGEKLHADEGINLPDSALRLAALTAKDIEDLAFVASHADIVELSRLAEIQEEMLWVSSRCRLTTYIAAW
jgi:pyruvate kinase